jgi:mannose-6-phosphate isomerase-like protein (cupin superfamily)
MTIEKVNLAAKLALINESWQPRIAGQVNDSHIKLVKFTGDFLWHQHEHEDELFLVVKGRFCMKLRDGDQWIEQGELIIIPKGVEHCPYAPEECEVLLVEPVSTLNTGNVRSERTVERPQAI